MIGNGVTVNSDYDVMRLATWKRIQIHKVRELFGAMKRDESPRVLSHEDEDQWTHVSNITRGKVAWVRESKESRMFAIVLRALILPIFL